MDSGSDSESVFWIQWWCGLKENDYFVEVDEDYIQDEFNLTGLRGMVPNYDYALDLILDCKTDEVLSEEHQEIIESNAEMLYGLIHARYILTNRGLAAMAEKLNEGSFGTCPRVYCQNQNVIPVGESDIPRMNSVKLFCPGCQEVYRPRRRRHGNIDGAYFGTTFSHLLLQLYPELCPEPTRFHYVPRIYGFRIHESAREINRKLLRQQQQQQQSRQMEQQQRQQQQQHVGRRSNNR
eukprot:TRINITY_DN1381_c0_g1_i3.p1 TRINITY_DN1381_c0_g1~~TRINITY_DN1381_c0_g1_i3.p1  ORF type:complete len:237 (+),score=51.31 TRINITY_DN1381_c0_g1_i3:228-938(+)